MTFDTLASRSRGPWPCLARRSGLQGLAAHARQDPRHAASGPIDPSRDSEYYLDFISGEVRIKNKQKMNRPGLSQQTSHHGVCCFFEHRLLGAGSLRLIGFRMFHACLAHASRHRSRAMKHSVAILSTPSESPCQESRSSVLLCARVEQWRFRGMSLCHPCT